MQTSKTLLKFVLNIFPPLLFNRIVLTHISDDYMQMKVVIKRSLLNINFHKTIFGGSIFSGCDPYFPTMYYKIFEKRNRKLIVWLKSAEIKYLKPANTSLKLHFTINQDDIDKASEILDKTGKYEVWHTVNAINKKNLICAKAKMLIYLKDNQVNKNLGF